MNEQNAKAAVPHSWVYVRQYCAEIDEAARNRMELIVRSLAEQNGVTEQLKADEYCSQIGEIYDIVIEDMDRQARGLKG